MRNGECGVRNGSKAEWRDESQFWLELLIEHGLLAGERASTLRDEAGQLVAIAVTSIRTARGARGHAPHSAFRTPQSPLYTPQSL
jgi:hypothetical protein